MSGPARLWRAPRVLARVAEWLVIDAIAIGLWALSGGGGFWPGWIILVGVLLVGRSVSKEAARAERARRRAERTRTPPPFLGR